MRAQFESWITAPPFERNVDRWPNDESKHAWPGQYKDISVQLAWEAWKDAFLSGLKKASEIADNYIQHAGNNSSSQIRNTILAEMERVKK